jgi:hypothetical protein
MLTLPHTPTTHRTTLTLESEVFEFVKTYAAAKAMKLSEAVNDLILMAKREERVKIIKKQGVWMFDLPKTQGPNAGKKISSEQVKELLEQD